MKLLRTAKAGDTIVFDSVSRMSRNAAEGFETYQKLFGTGVSLVFLKERHIDTDTYKKALVTVFSEPPVDDIYEENRAYLISEIYDSNNEYREDFVLGALYDAALAALEEDAATVSWDVTLNLIYQDGQWWIMPDQSLLQAISGGVLN